MTEEEMRRTAQSIAQRVEELAKLSEKQQLAFVGAVLERMMFQNGMILTEIESLSRRMGELEMKIKLEGLSVKGHVQVSNVSSDPLFVKDVYR